MYLFGNNIILIGFMGSGKSTVGRRASELFELNFVDIDDEIKKQYDMTISNIFDNFGEKSFRAAEKKNIRLFSYMRESIISTGGGAILDIENVNIIKRSGIVIHLKASVDTIIKNITSETSNNVADRPLLKTDDLRNKIIDILTARKKLYQKACHYEIEVDGLSIDQIVEKVYYAVEYYTNLKQVI